MCIPLIYVQIFKTLTAESGIIQSPGYPADYPANADCYWEVVRPKDGACVLFTVEDFVVPSKDEVTGNLNCGNGGGH